MKRGFGYFFLLLMVFSIVGCKKEEPNPELLDPIYQDLSKRSAESQKAYDDEVKDREGILASMEKAEPNSPELRNAKRDLEKSNARILNLEQMAHYYKIRSERRLVMDHISYKAAFASNEKWPDPREYSDYLLNIHLREAPLNWSAHVPRLQDRVAKAVTKTEKSKETDKKAEE